MRLTEEAEICGIHRIQPHEKIFVCRSFSSGSPTLSSFTAWNFKLRCILHIKEIWTIIFSNLTIWGFRVKWQKIGRIPKNVFEYFHLSKLCYTISHAYIFHYNLVNQMCMVMLQFYLFCFVEITMQRTREWVSLNFTGFFTWI